MKKLIILFFLPVQIALSQNEITLDSCYQWARENYPNLKQSKLYSEISELKIDNLKTSYLPGGTLKGQATYQSDVTTVDVPVPGITIPSISKDQYKFYLEFQQNIWDGGTTQSQKALEEAVLKTNLSQVEVELYQLNEKVNQAWFSALMAKQNKAILETQQSVLDEKIKAVESGVNNGVVEASNLDALQAEKLSTGQAILEAETGYSVSLKMLSILTGKNIDESVKLMESTVEPAVNGILSRPELTFFRDQSSQLDTKAALLDHQRYPRFFGFGQGGVGRPGLNMLSNDFQPYYLIGIGMSWNAFDWQKTKREKQIIGLQKDMIQSQQETFEQNINLLLEQQSANIRKIKTLIESDREIIALRQKIARSSASRLENGTINSADYIADLDAATIAQIKLETHKIQLDEAIIKYNTIKGKVK